LEEVEVVAGMIQKSLKQDKPIALSDIALLLPSDSTYSAAVQEVFHHAGLPVSGLVVKQQNRDLGHEVVFHLLQTLRKPAPTMAMAAFVTSPLLPWSRSQGFEIAAALMGGNYALKKIELPTQAGNDILDLIRHGVDTVAKLKSILKTFPSLLNNMRELEGQRSAAIALCDVLQKQLESTDIPWDTLIAMAAPHPDTIDVAGDFTREGIAVFYDHEEPWKTVKTLYVLGFNDGHYPNEARTSPVFSDADITVLRSQGLELERSVDIGDRQRALFNRQLLAAKENIHFLLSRRDSYGKQLSPSASLPFMAQLFDVGEEPESLILELDTDEGRNQATGLALASDADPILSRELEIKNLKLENNLLEVLKNRDGSVRPQSPSSLETLMTSPLAWLLNRSSLEPKDWEPEKLYVMSKGTLAHAVFENLFAPGQPLPSETEVRQRVPTLLLEAIISIKPFLNRPEWRVERYHLEKETLTAAQRWREVLETLGAKVLGVEVWLKGLLNQQPIHGSADLLLELPDGKIFVVDYKKSSSKKRKERMGKGFDSQASLYRIMLQTGEGNFRSSDGSTVTIETDREIGALYYLMNDQVALADTDGWIADSLRDFEELGADVSANALPLIRDRLAQVKMGHILLNKDTDEAWYEKNAGVPLYALNNSPLIRMFMHQEQGE
ncbi:MAG: PD-(D/E)XK nuclease family protein, partial [Desulfuromusa sp.]